MVSSAIPHSLKYAIKNIYYQIYWNDFRLWCLYCHEFTHVVDKGPVLKYDSHIGITPSFSPYVCPSPLLLWRKNVNSFSKAFSFVFYMVWLLYNVYKRSLRNPLTPFFLVIMKFYRINIVFVRIFKWNKKKLYSLCYLYYKNWFVQFK